MLIRPLPVSCVLVFWGGRERGSISANVIVRKDGQQNVRATVTKAHPTLVDYDILYPSGDMEEGVPAHLLRDLRVGPGDGCARG